jgi:hypothetical protein
MNPAAQSLGRLGGAKTSEAKTAAARRNGRKGGWPKGRPRGPSEVAAIFNCPVENVRAQYLRNAAQLEAMAAKTEATGKPVNGYTAESLRKHAASAKAKANE